MMVVSMHFAFALVLVSCAIPCTGLSPPASQAPTLSQDWQSKTPRWYTAAAMDMFEVPDWATPPIRRSTKLRGASPPQQPKAPGVFDDEDEDSKMHSQEVGKVEGSLETEGTAAAQVHEEAHVVQRCDSSTSKVADGQPWESEHLKARRTRQALFKKHEREYLGYPVSLRNVEIAVRELGKIKEQLRNAGQIDGWSKEIWALADEYDVSKIQAMLSKRREDLKIEPGRPLWVQLPLGGNNWVDATRLTTGMLIEAVLTCGQMLPRGSDGRCIRPDDLPPMLAREEPLKSLLRHRLVLGVDDWGISEEEDHGGDVLTFEQFKEEELGPYKEAYERFYFGQGNYSLEDEEKVLELNEWRLQRKVDRAVGQNKTNEMLWKALHDEKFEDAEMLVRKGGAQLHALDYGVDGLNALQQCVSDCNEKGVRLCTELGAGLEAHDEEGRTAFLVAAWYADVSMVKLLIKLGADVHATDRRGWTCFHYAAISGAQRELKAIFDEFLNASVDLRSRDVAGRTPRELALAFGYRAVEEYLGVLEEGGDAQATLIGCDWSKPEPGELVPGGDLFLDSSDSAADKDHPFYPIFSNVKKIKKAEMQAQLKSEDGVSEEDMSDFIDQQAQRFRRYDGKDWADPITVRDLDEIRDVVERAPAVFMKQETIEELVQQGAARWRDEADDAAEDLSVDVEGLVRDYDLKIDEPPPLTGLELPEMPESG